MKHIKKKMNYKGVFWFTKMSIITSILLLSLYSCKKEVTKIETNENFKEVKNNFISFELPGKRGSVTHHKKGPILPFENSYLPVPKDFTGNTFSLRHDYPVMGSVETPETYPWKAVTGNGAITQSNSLDYVQALKEYISTDMKKLLYDYDNWKPSEEPWYQSIWLGQVREPIHGMYVGSAFPAKSLGNTQKDSLTTYVYTLYDKTAAQTLNNIWGTDSINAYEPNLKDAKKTQYAEGSVIVKFAFVNYSNSTNDWAPLNGSVAWDVYTDVLAGSQAAIKGATPTIRTLKLMQCDIIVKDTNASPVTGWVFSTLVYDNNLSGDAWDKMVPLGATWGNDPDIITLNKGALEAPVVVNKLLEENWVNPETPLYSRSTLGWDGRLSGPNDGAVFGGKITAKDSLTYNNLASVGCLGCHSTAQYKDPSFLVPLVPPTLSEVYTPGSPEWLDYFKNRQGTKPKNSGTDRIGLDFDMVTSFKAIPAWKKATGR